MLEGNDLTVLHNGEAAYPVMLKAISEAKERVFLSSFIFGYDEVGKSFAAARAPLPNADATCACSWTAWAPSTCGRAGANASARTSSSPTSCRRASSRPSFPSTCGRTAKS
ncbi:MAG: hypothetical protein ACLSAH_16555 [Bilophila wadsworthia]